METPFNKTLRDYWNSPSALDGVHQWVTEISTRDRDQFYINGSDEDEWFGLDSAYVLRSGHTSRVAEIFYDAEGGYDVLQYNGGQVRLMHVSVTDREFNGEDYFLRFSGGYTTGLLSQNGVSPDVTDNLKVFDRDDLEKAILSSSSDVVDLAGLPMEIDTEFHGKMGWDKMFGSEFGDKFDGGGEHDTLKGYGGDDGLDGGAGDDLLKGGAGDDFISSAAGTDSIGGVSGSDVISVFLDISATDEISITCDGFWEDRNDYFDDASGHEWNQGDVFSFGYTTTYLTEIVVGGKSETEDFMAAKAEAALVETGSKLIASAMGVSWASPGIEFGYHALKSALLGG